MKPSGYVLLICLLISLFAVDAYFSSSNEEYSMYNTNWDGTSYFMGDALSEGAVPLCDYTMLDGIKNSTLILIEPDGIFSYEELCSLKNYKTNGNIIIISDEEGLSTTVLKYLGTDLSVEHVNLSSVDREYDDPGFIICYASDDSIIPNEDHLPGDLYPGEPQISETQIQEIKQIMDGVTSIVLNKPSVAAGGDALISTSFLSWVDTNGNGRADTSEALGKQSVFVVSGTIYLLSDSGIFQNAIYKDETLKDNRRFITNILQSSDRVYLDTAHSKIASEEGIAPYLTWIRNSEMIKTAAIIIIIALLLLLYRDRHDS